MCDCNGISVETPVLHSNRSGLSAIAYRIGTHQQFIDSIQARLATGGPALRGLTTRRSDDFTMGLLDAWATVADVLTFYQERIANETYLRTATERLSVLEMARLIGYELQPGVAASTYLAFTLDDPVAAFAPQLVPGTTHSGPTDAPIVPIPALTRVQSIPGPNEDPQTFETVETIEGRAEWNALRPRLTQPQTLTPSMDVLLLRGTANALKPGDVIVINKVKLRKVLNVSTDEDNKTTRVDFAAQTSLPTFVPLVSFFGTFSSIGLGAYTQHTSAQLRANSWRESDIAALSAVNKWSMLIVRQTLSAPLALSSPTPEHGAHVFRKRAAFFGYNAPKKVTYNTDGMPKDASEWIDWDLDENTSALFLDTTYDDILPDSLIALQETGESLGAVNRIRSVQQADSTTRTAYGMSGKTTRLTVSGSWLPSVTGDGSIGKLRSQTVYAQSEGLPLADLPITTPVLGHSLTLDRYYSGLKAGRVLLLTGIRTDLSGNVMASEVITINDVTIVEGFTTLEFEQDLAYSYVRSSVTLNGNVARATHGETVTESLGNGDASQLFQRFVLRQPPLTYTSGTSANGVTSTLEIWVNDLRWQQVPTLINSGPHERVYTTQLNDAGQTTVLFGDGITGARLPTGQANIRATYRKGMGLGGLVRANQLSQLMNRPASVKGVNNPLPASGAADRESLTDARQNAPLQVLTLDRVVSLQDYTDFARSYAGIAKASATYAWFGQHRGIFLTIAGANGATLGPGDAVFTNLIQAIRQAGDSTVALRMASYIPAFFQLIANVQSDPNRVSATVFAAIETALRQQFSFASRHFGQPVTYSEVVATIQAVPGVVAVELDAFFRTDDTLMASVLPRLLEARMPQPGTTTPQPAELLTLDPRPLTLRPML